MIKKYLCFLIFGCFFVSNGSAQYKDTITVMSYNLLNFPDGRNDCGTNTLVPSRWDTLAKIVSYVKPDILMVCELQNEKGADSILNRSLNTNGITYYSAANFVLNKSGFTGLNNMFYYNSSKVTLHSQSEILTGTRDVGEYIVYPNDTNLSKYNDTTFIDFYMCHLKAGSGSADIADREAECTDIRNHIDAKPNGRNNIIGGDFNFYTATEGGYQVLCYSGTYPFNDPISREGDWNNNSLFADVHTQSTRSSVNIECGATGGMDDRFDLILVSDNVLTGGNRVKFLSGTYTGLGNNGSTFNKNINDAGNTSSVPTDILNALYYMSDHLPVVSQFEITYPSGSLSLQQPEKKIYNKPKSENSFKLYPNPSTGNFKISLSGNEDSKVEIEIFDLAGKSLKSYTVHAQKGLNTFEMEMENAENGIYIIHIQTDNYKYVGKISIKP